MMENRIFSCVALVRSTAKINQTEAKDASELKFSVHSWLLSAVNEVSKPEVQERFEIMIKKLYAHHGDLSPNIEIVVVEFDNQDVAKLRDGSCWFAVPIEEAEAEDVLSAEFLTEK